MEMRWLRNRSTKAFRSILLELRWKCRFGEVWVHLETRVLPSTERLAGQHIKPHLLLVLMCCLLFALLGSSLSNPTFPLHRPLPVVLWPDRPIALPRVGSFPSRAVCLFSTSPGHRWSSPFHLFALSPLNLRVASPLRLQQSLFIAPATLASLPPPVSGLNLQSVSGNPAPRSRHRLSPPLGDPIRPFTPIPAQQAPDTSPNRPRVGCGDQNPAARSSRDRSSTEKAGFAPISRRFF